MAYLGTWLQIQNGLIEQMPTMHSITAVVFPNVP